MPFPAGLTLVTVACRFDLPPTGGAHGKVTFTPTAPLVGAADGSIVPAEPTTGYLAADGTCTIVHPATNDPGWTPVNSPINVVARVGTTTITGTLLLDYQTTSVELADLLQVDGAAVAGQTYIQLSQRGVAGGVAALDADGDVNDASGAKITGGGGGGAAPSGTVVSETAYGQSATAGNATAYSRGNHTHGTPALGTTGTTAAAGNDSRLSDARTPTAHASSHASAGSDPVTIAATQISDSTSTGRSLVTATDAAAARTAISAQPLDSDLTTLAGLTATTDNVLQSVAGAWASRTPAQVRTALTLVPSILLGPSDPVPGGTPTNTLVIRTT